MHSKDGAAVAAAKAEFEAMLMSMTAAETGAGLIAEGCDGSRSRRDGDAVLRTGAVCKERPGHVPAARRSLPVSWDKFHRDAARSVGASPPRAPSGRSSRLPGADCAGGDRGARAGGPVIETVCVASCRDYKNQGGLRSQDHRAGSRNAGRRREDCHRRRSCRHQRNRQGRARMLPKAHFATSTPAAGPAARRALSH